MEEVKNQLALMESMDMETAGEWLKWFSGIDTRDSAVLGA